MRAILIDPLHRTIEIVETSGGLEALYSLLSFEGKPKVDDINAVNCGKGHVLWVDGEGALKPGNPLFQISVYPTPLAGRGLILGISSEGEDASVTLSLADFSVSFPKLQTTGKLGPATSGPGFYRFGDPIYEEKP